MKFELSEDQQLLRDSTREFLSAEHPLEKTRRFVENDARGFGAEAWRKLAELGYLGLALPVPAGGQGLGLVELAIVLEEMGRVCFPGPYLDVVLAARLLAAAGREQPVREIASGERLVVLARRDSAFAGRPARTTEFASGRVRGRKFFVPFAADAHALVVETPQGFVLVEGPFETTAMPTMDPTARFAEVELDHAGERIDGDELSESLTLEAATTAAAMLLGLMSRALEITLDYVKTRQTFGRPIGSFQALQHRLADMLLRTESTRAAAYRAAWCLDVGDPDAALAAASAKAYAGDAARSVCGEAIQMHGGIGFTWEVDAHFFLKRVKTLEQFHGSTEEQLERALAAAGL